jgi:hypothetical protein
MKYLPALALASMALLAPPASSFAQDRSPDGRGGFNIEEYRKRMNERLKESLKANDEEWTVLQPMIEKVTEKQRETMGSRFGGRGPGGPGGPGGSGGSSSSGGSGGSGGSSSSGSRSGGSPERDALREALEKESTSPEEMRSRLEAVRAQRKRAAAELEGAREELKKVVTVRQEAVLVAFGILE